MSRRVGFPCIRVAYAASPPENAHWVARIRHGWDARYRSAGIRAKVLPATSGVSRQHMRNCVKGATLGDLPGRRRQATVWSRAVAATVGGLAGWVSDRSSPKVDAVLSRPRARELAEEFARNAGRALVPGEKDLEHGWYFAWRNDGLAGSHGFAISKATGTLMHFGSAFSVERDLRMYDLGMDAERHDLVILEIANADETVEMLRRVAPSVVELSYGSGTVWRIPRRLTEEELRSRLARLPAIFPDVRLYFAFEAIETARHQECCVMELLSRPPLTPSGRGTKSEED